MREQSRHAGGGHITDCVVPEVSANERAAARSLDWQEVEWPKGAELVAHAILVALAAVGALTLEGGFRWEVAVVLAIGLSPWLAHHLGLRVPTLLHATVFLGSVALVNLGGFELGWLEDPYHGQLTLMLLVFVVGEVASTRDAKVSVPIALAALLIVVGRRAISAEFDSALVWAIAVALVFVGGALINHQMRVTTALRRAQAALAAEATEAERARIARDVHDTVAHSLAVTVLHLNAARLAVERDPATATEAIRRAEELTRDSLADVRRTVGLLRRGETSATDAALPGLDDLEPLIEQYRAASVEIDATLPHADTAATSTEALTVYRVVQEALANVAKHAPRARVSVRVAASDDELAVLVADDGHGVNGHVPDGAGLGLRGMQERLEQLGGTLVAGRADGQSGWVVEARIPRVVDR